MNTTAAPTDTLETITKAAFARHAKANGLSLLQCIDMSGRDVADIIDGLPDDKRDGFLQRERDNVRGTARKLERRTDRGTWSRLDLDGRKIFTYRGYFMVQEVWTDCHNVERYNTIVYV